MAEETLSARQIARMIDVSAVHTQHGEAEIRELVEIAKTNTFGSVHVLPAWVPYAKTLLADAPDIVLGAPVGFPSGGHHTAVKRAEAAQIVQDGVGELDMMLNVGKLRSGDDGYVLDEIRAVIDAVPVPVKVILETHYLTNDEILRGCELAIQGDAKYVKTSTGWTSTGATLANIALITGCVAGRIGVKASGGIRDLDTLLQMYRMGARRFGINAHAAVEIVKACRRLPGESVRVTS
jgi:deoxyribose-phosphate aldolase